MPRGNPRNIKERVTFTAEEVERIERVAKARETVKMPYIREVVLAQLAADERTMERGEPFPPFLQGAPEVTRALDVLVNLIAQRLEQKKN